MRGVDLDRVQTQPHRASRGRDELVAHPRQLRRVEGVRRLLAVGMRHRRRRHRLPPGWRIRSDLLPALPRHLARRLAAGVRELDPDLGRRVTAHRRQHAPQAGLVLVGIQAEIARRDPAFRRHRGRFDQQQPGATERQVAEVEQVPVARRALARGVLAHRCDDDPVGERERTDLERFEQPAHGTCIRQE